MDLVPFAINESNGITELNMIHPPNKDLSGQLNLTLNPKGDRYVSFQLSAHQDLIFCGTKTEC
jgi:hypothetical protein